MGCSITPSQRDLWTKELKAALPNLKDLKVTFRNRQDAAYLPEEALECVLHDKDETLIGSFILCPAPYSNLLWSCQTQVTKAYKRRGIATEMMKQKKRICRDLGFMGLAATVSNVNTAQISLLKKNGWAPLIDYGSATLWGCDLKRFDRQYI